jgi:hypothetical protein
LRKAAQRHPRESEGSSVMKNRSWIQLQFFFGLEGGKIASVKIR